MTTPLLPFDGPVELPRAKKSGHVRATSVLAYRELGGKVDARAETVLTGLGDYWRRYQMRPTVGELSQFLRRDRVWTARGMSTLVAQSRVESGSKRRCNLTRKTVLTWRPRERS